MDAFRTWCLNGLHILRHVCYISWYVILGDMPVVSVAVFVTLGDTSAVSVGVSIVSYT